MQVGVYIDGFNLYYGGRGLCGKGTPGWRWLDLRALAERVITNHSTWAGATIHRVIYCTAVISGADNPVGNREQDVYLRALKRAQVTDRIELGTYVRRVATAPLATPDRNGRPVLTNPTWPVMVKDGAGQDDPQAQFFVSVALRGCNPPRRAGGSPRRRLRDPAGRVGKLAGCWGGSPGAARKTAKPTHPALGASPRETGAVFDRAAANLRHGKGGKQRVVPITDTVDDDEIRAAMTAAVAG